MSSASTFYQKLLGDQAQESRVLKHQLNQWVAVRLTTFLVFGGSIFFWIKWGSWWMGVLAFVGIVTFLWSIVRHKRVQEAHEFSKACESTLQQELQGLVGNWQPLISSPQANPNHPYAHDLDIMGSRSVFDHLNRCRTLAGQRLLEDHLLGIPYSEDKVKLHQRLAKETSTMHYWRIRIGAAGDLLREGKGEVESISSWCRQTSNLFTSRLYQVGKWVVPVWCITFVVLTASSVLPLVLGGTLVLLPLIPVAMNLRESNRLNLELTDQLKSLKKFDKLLIEMRQVNSSDSALISELEPLEEASGAFKKLTSILERFDQRNNLIVATITNVLYWSEVRNVQDLDGWRMKYGERVENWLLQIGRVEVLASLGAWTAHMDSEHCWPQWSASDTFVATDLKHPLMQVCQAIGNPVELGEGTQIRIITGANMAGKSTYLRTVGVNYVLAHLGLPLHASSAKFSEVKLLTSMRTSDSLQDDTSYFLAELKRLAFIIEDLEKDGRTLILLDEILKGTNSNDKAEGSKAFIEQLVHKPVSVLVATHDLSLCDLESTYPKEIKNQHFAAHIQDNDLSFSFEIQPGICDTMNATFLMKKLGIIPRE